MHRCRPSSSAATFSLYVYTVSPCLYCQITAIIWQAGKSIEEASGLHEAGCCTAPSACAVLPQDCAVLPWFVRGYIMEHFRQLRLPPDDCPKVQPSMLCSWSGCGITSIASRCTTLRMLPDLAVSHSCIASAYKWQHLHHGEFFRSHLPLRR